MSSFEQYKIGHRNVKAIDVMLNELAELPELVAELNEHFNNLDGTKGRDEFSACITFFFLGRLYERSLKQKGGTNNATS